MAADETLLLGAAEGRASLRFYGWAEATLSLGYFQPASASRADRRLTSLPWVRRPTGGSALVHHHELTYALAVPLSGETKPRSWMVDMHQIFSRALEPLGLRGQLQSAKPMGHAASSNLCFAQPTAGDILHGCHKLLGSSQRKHHRALLQHGALLLAQSPYTPMLPGIKELTGVDLAVEPLVAAIIQVFQEVADFRVEPTDWSPAEKQTIERLTAEKYSRAEWNEKR